MKNMFHIALVSAAILSGIENAQASSVTISTDTESLQQRNSKQYFSQDGLSGEEAKIIPGAGAAMPLKAAARILVPSNWKIVGSGEFESALISWRGNLTWPQILRDIAQREQIYISLDWVQKIASINVPSTHKLMASIPANNSKRQSPEIVVQKKPEIATYSEKVSTKKDKVSPSIASASIEKSKSELAIVKKSQAADSSAEYIKNLERERLALIEKNNAALREAERKSEELKTLKSKYAIVDTTKVLPPSIDAAKIHQMYKERNVLPFDASFEYFIKGGHADRFKPDTPATYIAKAGSVESIIRAWADAVGYGVEYRAGVNHPNDYEVELKGSFFDASVEFIRAYETSDRPLNIEFYPDVRVSESKKGLVIISDLTRK